MTGFTEQRGSQNEEHRYGPGSPYYQRDITRFFTTTGVCWYFRDKSICSEAVASRILETFCGRFGIQERDLGVGLFFTKQAPFETTTCQGACIFDATNGSLRLTQRLAERYAEVLALAIETAEAQKEKDAVGVLRAFSSLAGDLRSASSPAPATLIAPSAGGEEWVVVIAHGQPAVYLSDDGPRTVVVKGHRYTPQGLMYQLEPTIPSVWMVAVNALESINGQTKMIRANLMTGETEGLPEDRARPKLDEMGRCTTDSAPSSGYLVLKSHARRIQFAAGTELADTLETRDDSNTRIPNIRIPPHASRSGSLAGPLASATP